MVAKLQVFCSEDLGAFYLDILKDRLYTTRAGVARAPLAQTALWHITHAMLRWMAPFLSLHRRRSVEGVRANVATVDLPRDLCGDRRAATPTLLAKWAAHPRRRATMVNKEIEALRDSRQGRLVAAGRRSTSRCRCAAPGAARAAGRASATT